MAEKKESLVHYDSGDDSFTFINQKNPADHTINTGLVLISVSKNKKIVGLELMGAHKNFSIPKKVLLQ